MVLVFVVLCLFQPQVLARDDGDPDRPGEETDPIHWACFAFRNLLGVCSLSSNAKQPIIMSVSKNDVPNTKTLRNAKTLDCGSMCLDSSYSFV